MKTGLTGLGLVWGKWGQIVQVEGQILSLNVDTLFIVDILDFLKYYMKIFILVTESSLILHPRLCQTWFGKWKSYLIPALVSFFPVVWSLANELPGSWSLTSEHPSRLFLLPQTLPFSGLPQGLSHKESAAMQEMQVQSLGWQDVLEEEMVTHPSFLAWKISWSEKPGRLQFMGLQKSQVWLSRHAIAIIIILTNNNIK